MYDFISLDRQFSLITLEEYHGDSLEIHKELMVSQIVRWSDLEKEFRSVILSEAGAGKTAEFIQQARKLSRSGKTSFFIRIEDIDTDFYKAFEVGDEDDFSNWLTSVDEAWFFLDSVDEAKLGSPRDFEKAIIKFAKTIKNAAHRAHIYISGRPYSYLPISDGNFLKEHLPFPIASTDGRTLNALSLFILRPLNQEMIKHFCEQREAENIGELINEIERMHLLSLAERPFDLQGILSKWKNDRTLGSYYELLNVNINTRLKDSHSLQRAQRQRLSHEKLRAGAQRLAAAVHLAGQPNIKIPESQNPRPGIDAVEVLKDWSIPDVMSLLDCGVFNDVIFGAVRFRHRDIRELLAAEWFQELLVYGHSRLNIESLFFREQYGNKIITPSLRPVLPWLLINDSSIRTQAFNIDPEIVFEGGDPVRLPLEERKLLLRDIIGKVSKGEEGRYIRTGNSIERIAYKDLSKEIISLIEQHSKHSDIVYFLGRLVWLGNMSDCIEPLIKLAVDFDLTDYARFVCIRSIMTCGLESQKKSVWEQLNNSDAVIPREFLSELVIASIPNGNHLEHLIRSLKKLPPYERYKGTGLSHALHDFIRRSDEATLINLIKGFYSFLTEEPFISNECKVSAKYAWLLSPTAGAIQQIVLSKNPFVFDDSVLSILLMVPNLKYWHRDEFSEFKGDFSELIPQWPALNDALYWATVNQVNNDQLNKNGEHINSDAMFYWKENYWSFDLVSFPRLLDFIKKRTLSYEKKVALHTAFRIYSNNNKPTNLLSSLQEVVSSDANLKELLDNLLDPQLPPELVAYQKDQEKITKKHLAEKRKQDKERDNWIVRLKADPSVIISRHGLKSDECSWNHYYLYKETISDNSSRNNTDGTNWQSLTKVFGAQVAENYRDSAIQFWRNYKPRLQSEGHVRDNTISFNLMFAQAGINIETTQNNDFPKYLNFDEVQHILRYVVWEINGLPSWFDKIYHTFPALTLEALLKEIRWELDNAYPLKSPDSILNKIAYRAPWIHAAVAPEIYSWAMNNGEKLNSHRLQAIKILVNGNTAANKIAALAKQQLRLTPNDSELLAWWHAILVDSEPNTGVENFIEWLSTLDKSLVSKAAQIFITNLVGGRFVQDGGPYMGLYKTAPFLKQLYLAMHHHVRVADDLDRADGRVYSPELRDSAQEAREKLLEQLLLIPGKDTYIAFKELADELPTKPYRQRMREEAIKRSAIDGDMEAWTSQQIFHFYKQQTLRPVTHKQLYEVTVNRLLDLKNWLELGNDSTWRTWQRAVNENEIRGLVAAWLNDHCRGNFVTAQEPELANTQRMDIWMHNPDIKSPVPIELKLLDKGWTGPQLCERLKNQLVGDYLREKNASCGVMLLIAQDVADSKGWKVNKKTANLYNLSTALKTYWSNIEKDFQEIESINIITIDLKKRGLKSELSF